MLKDINLGERAPILNNRMTREAFVELSGSSFSFHYFFQKISSSHTHNINFKKIKYINPSVFKPFCRQSTHYVIYEKVFFLSLCPVWPSLSIDKQISSFVFQSLKQFYPKKIPSNAACRLFCTPPHIVWLENLKRIFKAGKGSPCIYSVHVCPMIFI